MAYSGSTPPQAQPVQGKVRWRRFAVMLVPSAAIAAVLIGLTATGVLAASISVSGQQFVVAASELDGTNFSQYGGLIQPAGKGPTPVVVSVMDSAKLHNLCQSVSAGPINLVLTAGGGGNPASASNLVVDAAGQTATNATFHNISIGQNATQLNGSGFPDPTPGGFGQMADSVVITNLHQDTWYTTAGTFTLPGLNLHFGGSCP
ncbi:MAG: DUF6230 family protein [Gemmatimonadota bacterium]